MIIDLRSPVVQTVVRAITPLAVMVGIYLLFAGHNHPGGGFAAGLVLGAIVALRVMADLQKPTHAFGLTTIGMVIVAFVAVMPILWGDPLLDMKIVEATVPLLDKVKAGSALPFDIGVMFIVVGLIIAILDGLSAPEFDGEPDERAPAAAGSSEVTS